MTENRLAVGEVRRVLGERVNARGFRIFSSEARAQALVYARQRLGDGVTAREIADELGLIGWTLQRWLQREGQDDTKAVDGFVQLEVRPTPASALVVRGPCGIWIEGLAVEGVAELVRSLSCLG